MNKKTIYYYKIFLFLPFLLFILINAFSIFYINIPSDADKDVIEHNKEVLEGEGISVNLYGLFLFPLLFFWLFGISNFTLRISQVFFLFLTLFLFSKLKLSPMKKIMGLFLIATSPFIIPGRSEVNFLPFFVLFPFILLDGKKITTMKVFLSSLVFGFGIALKLTILYFALPFLAFFTLFKRLGKREILCLVLGLILGFSPFLIAEATYNFPTFKYGIEVILNKKTSQSYEMFNLLPNLVLVLSYFKDSFNLIPYDLLPSYEFFRLPLVELSNLLLVPIYFSLFFFSSFILMKKRQRLELILPFLTFIFLLQFNPTHPKPVHFYFLFPFVIFLILEWMNKKYLPFLIIPLIVGSLLTYEIIKNLPNEKFFPAFGSHNHELLAFLKTSNSSILVTSIHEITGFHPFLSFKEMIVPIKFSFENGAKTEVDGGKIKEIYSHIEKNESLIFIFPSYERKALKERLIYRACYSINYTDYSRMYPCYDATKIIKDEVKKYGKLELIKTINDSNNVPVYEIFSLCF